MSTTNPEIRVEPRKYYCTMDKPLYMEKHVWNTIWLSVAHFFGLQGWFMFITGAVPRSMFPILIAYGYMSGFGITVGCHRYWTHRTFKAKLPLQLILAYCQTAAVQYPIFKWCRDHRLHHKYVETDADPHDARRGFWFSHMGWLFQKEHPQVLEKEATLDLSDLDNDPIVRFQTKYYFLLLIPTVYLVPISILHFLWPQVSLYNLICVNYIWYITALHFTWLVNSAAHMYGYRTYDEGIHASENWLVSLLAIGEGWHNYHHVFPWDYKAAELGFYKANWSTMVIDFFAWIGWAYDLKTVPEDVVMQRVMRTGNVELHHSYKGEKSGSGVKEVLEKALEELPPWGWGDKDIPEEHFQITEILRASKAA